MTELFNEFESVSSKAWKQKIQVDLKGADYNESLIWKSNEGIDVKPFYHADDLPPIIPNISKTATKVNISQSIFVSDSKNANAKASEAIKKGADSLIFVLPSDEINIHDLLANLGLDSIPVYFNFQFLDSDYIKSLAQLADVVNFRLNFDIIGNLGRSGNWFHNLNKDHQLLDEIMSYASAFKSVLSVDLSLYQNAGANMVQQLAYGLAHANEYLNHYNENIDQTIVFNVTVGTNYFFEIAKLRALRILWASLAKEYNANPNCEIIVTPTKRNKTVYDYNINMLRTTTECMSAILGGADSICNLPYDAIYHKDNAFGERISRNQLLILKHESYFDVVNNPSDGTYYIENLTSEMAQKALDLFKDIESNKGFLAQLKNGTIQRKIKESAAKEQQQFDDGEKVLLGSNKHPNPQDRMKDELELYPFVKIKKRKTIIEPIIEKTPFRGIRTRTFKNRIKYLKMKRTIVPILLLAFIYTNCKPAPKIDYKFGEEKNLFPCSSVDMDLIKEAVYVFEEFIFENYSFNAPDKEKAAYFNFLKNSEVKLMPMGEKFDDHIKNVFYALKTEESLWSGTQDQKTLNLDHEIIKCIIENINIEAIKPVFKTLAESKTLRGEVLAPTLRSYFNKIEEDRALATYIALDLFYAKIFQFDLSLTPVELAKQIRAINDKNRGHQH